MTRRALLAARRLAGAMPRRAVRRLQPAGPDAGRPSPPLWLAKVAGHWRHVEPSVAKLSQPAYLPQFLLAKVQVSEPV